MRIAIQIAEYDHHGLEYRRSFVVRVLCALRLGLAEKAVSFRIHDGGFHAPDENVHITRRDGMDKLGLHIVVRWAVELRGYVLSKSTLEWVWDPTPSSRTEEHIADTRFADPWEARDCWMRARAAGLRL